MLTRMRLLKGATALLYIGPLFAGISGFGWGIVAPFLAIFVVWLMILRPEQWPASPREWLTVSALGVLVAQILSQLLLISILLAVGRGLGAISGYLPVVNPFFPLAVSFMAIPLCRLLWDAEEAADAGIFLDDEAEAAHAPRAAAAAASAVVPLLNLPDTAPDAEVTAAVARVMEGPGADRRLSALSAALTQPDRSHAALRRALVLWASEPEIVAPGHVPGAMAHAFSIANGDPDLLRLYLPRAIALIGAFPDRADSFPTPEQVRNTVVGEPGEDSEALLPSYLLKDMQEGLVALANAIERTLDGPAAKVELRRDNMAPTKARHA